MKKSMILTQNLARKHEGSYLPYNDSGPRPQFVVSTF
jgi:hypothetical protein